MPRNVREWRHNCQVCEDDHRIRDLHIERHAFSSANACRAARAAVIQRQRHGGSLTTRAVLAYVADKPAALREFRRILKPGGRISIAEPILQGDALWKQSPRARAPTIPNATYSILSVPAASPRSTSPQAVTTTRIAYLNAVKPVTPHSNGVVDSAILAMAR